MIVTAQRQLCGDYGVLRPGESAELPDDLAKLLLKRGLVVYSRKDIVPSEGPQKSPEQPAKKPGPKPKSATK